MLIYLDLPPYLRDWLIHQSGGTTPVKFPRGSIEIKLLHISLRAPRAGEAPALRCPEGWTPVLVPVLKGISPDSQNYLPESGRTAIEATIRERFDLDLWTLATETEFGLCRIDLMVDAWMDARGIEHTDTNTQSILKRLQRLRKRVMNTRRQRRRRSKD